ncbi:MAG: hypothetical protein K2K75_08765 [Muribaculaceae bacterium]|nr:hypothetical protein [Muribaculaceae bacterium]
MKFHYLKSLSALALAGMFAANAYAETLSQEFVIDFTQQEVGFKLNSFWGDPNDHMAVVATDEGNLLLVDGVTVLEDGTEAVNEAGYPSWSTMTRYENLTLPSGFNFGNVLLIEVEYKPTQPDNVPFAIQLRGATDPLNFEGDVVVNEWNTLAFDPAELTTGEGSDAYTGTPTSFDFCMGANGSTNYYIKQVTFYLEKEVTQREKDEAALDKSTAACVEFNFDNYEVSGEVDGAFSSPYVGSNGGGINRPDMIIDKGPEGYDNNCAHIIYQGWTQIFITEPVVAPEGYTFDDLRLVEYDIYETDIPGVDYTQPDNPVSGRNGAPILKLKEWYAWGWCPNNDGSSCGNSRLPSVNEWHHVEFYPSAYEWKERDFEENVLDENGEPVLDEEGKNVTTPAHWDADQVRDEFGKLTSFNISIGFFPCLSQTYVDNVKLWFQKGGEEAVESVEAVKAANDVLYNVFGQRVDESYRGIVIKNGKKYINK